ncbi:tryptophan halogenase family protein [Paraglaciecola sp. L3A3]|uniref:tryptophan halogenase family protein n=1 Tax=Paraglaciecola sp. L3A3 TaxID=2686358 RepID=UPI00131E90CB|nr:tryptophan halogenase family protein [Paraglaciecola sp. L3A3]
MSTEQQIQTFVIVGGGTAGWISASILSRALAHLPCTIRLIESPHVPTVGVGEATIPSIVDMLEYLKIPLADFVVKTNASFKLGIKFCDWQTIGKDYWHPFGYVGSKIDGRPFYQHWLKHKMNGGDTEFTDFSPAIALSKQNRFFIPDPKQPSNLSSSTYALHFDATLVAQYLTNYCKNKKVQHSKGHVQQVNLNTDGQISHLIMEDGQRVDGDFFIDCSGQQSLLMGKAMRIGYENWQHYLPVNKAVAAQSEILSPLPSYTSSTAHEHGWRWQIPLQNRTGNGYVYCDQYCSDSAAKELLAKHVGEFITEPRVISFNTGKRKKMWHKNCLAIGLSSGFLEPLESTSIYLIMKAMLNFVQTIPSKKLYQAPINEFNRRMDHEYNCIRDFIILHYSETKRTDSEFWRMWQNLEIPDSLQTKLELFRSQGQLYHDTDDLFASDSWYSVLEGMGVRPSEYDPVIDSSDFAKIEKAFMSSKIALDNNAAKTLDHLSYLKRIKA